MNSFPGRLEGMHSAIPLRRRSVWEAADSGILLWRESFVYFIPFFALPVWIIACGLRLLSGNAIYLSYLFIWWLKPLFDRIILHVVSQKFFGSSSGTKMHKRFFASITPGLLGDLLWRRFSPYRSSRMPIRVLERAGRKQFRARKMALIPGGLNFCSFISSFCLAAEFLLLLGEIVFVMAIMQIFFPSFIEDFQGIGGTPEVFIFAAYCLNFFLLESLYVCMGFGLYINCRVEVEGWDLQLLFQKFAGSDEGVTMPMGDTENSEIAGKTAGVNAPPPAFKIFLAFFFSLALFFSPMAQQARAEDQSDYFPPEFQVSAEDSIQRLEEILASEDFGSYRDGWGIHLKRSEKDDPNMEFKVAPWMEKLNAIFGYTLRLFIVLAIAVSLGFLIYWFRKNYRNRLGEKNLLPDSGRNYTNPLFTQESPESLFARSESLYRLGNLRDAWAVCLQGCLGSYTRHCSLSFEPDATEYDCLELVNSALPGEAGAFGDLIHDWIFLAYGGRNPGDGAFERALAHGRSIGKGNFGVQG